ncbi:MAG: sigma-54-dependent Fis family transcriptional regulator [Candidatus Latescibacteria bacterium]|nr:sigma-54-dependent Fis family transcriptional regulator [Candidatus Latescibacterota bacterium]
MPLKLLIVDDEENVIHSLKRMLKNEQYVFFSALNGYDALEIFTEEEIDVALVDYKMPGMDGIGLLKLIKKKYPSTEVIIMSGYGTIESAVSAMRLGSYDYIIKPFDDHELKKTLKALVEKKALISENKRLQAELEVKYSFQGIVGDSHAMQEVYRTLKKVSHRDSPVLIQGESGTGKELIARSVHFNSPRAKKPFVTIDCSSISHQVIESELFGHVKGAFTGAFSSKNGMIKEADGGTVFIDEITEIPPDTQAKFLRVIQEKEIRPVGGTRSEPVDVRIIAATNRNIKNEVDTGNFRLDLFYRLNVVPVFLPPLRDRTEDIPLFVRHFMNEFRDNQNKFESISRDAIHVLMKYPWPGNVRELRNMIERIFVLGSGPVIETDHLPLELMCENVMVQTPSPGAKTLAEMEKDAILSALKNAGGNRIIAAQMLEMGKSTLYRKLKEYNIS